MLRTLYADFNELVRSGAVAIHPRMQLTGVLPADLADGEPVVLAEYGDDDVFLAVVRREPNGWRADVAGRCEGVA